MPTPTYTPLGNITVGTGATSVTFSSIPSYRDYIIIANIGAASGQYNYGLIINGDTTVSNYSTQLLEGTGGPVYTRTVTGQFAMIMSGYDTIQIDDGGNFSSCRMEIIDASATDKHKVILMRSGLPSQASVTLGAGKWASTAAVTSLKVIAAVGSGTLRAGSSFSLYGIAA